ncbi:hypothetical protein BD309DRAFT_584693 [Dichomitus squalens]|nr:hypothetical protein BD309DRAFT_584693 [Dichomitus squalens]
MLRRGHHTRCHKVPIPLLCSLHMEAGGKVECGGRVRGRHLGAGAGVATFDEAQTLPRFLCRDQETRLIKESATSLLQRTI